MGVPAGFHRVSLDDIVVVKGQKPLEQEHYQETGQQPRRAPRPLGRGDREPQDHRVDGDPQGVEAAEQHQEADQTGGRASLPKLMTR